MWEKEGWRYTKNVLIPCGLLRPPGPYKRGHVQRRANRVGVEFSVGDKKELLCCRSGNVIPYIRFFLQFYLYIASGNIVTQSRGFSHSVLRTSFLNCSKVEEESTDSP